MRTAFPTGFIALVRSGVVTHMVANPPSVDTAFAVAKAQDLPEVRFAAAFDDGTLLLGCPDGVPAELRDMAKPIDPDGMVEDGPAESNDGISARLDAIANQLAQAAPTQDMAERLARIEAALPAPTDLSPVVAGIEKLGQALTNPPDFTPVEAALQTLSTQVAQLGNGPDMPTDLSAEFTAIRDLITASTNNNANAGEAIRTAFNSLQDNIAAALAPLATGADIAALQETIAASPAAQPPASEPRDLVMLQDAVDQIGVDLRALLAQEADTTAVTEGLQALGTQATQTQMTLDQLAAQIRDAPHGPAQDFDLAPITELLDQISKQLTALSDQIAQTDSKVTEIAAQDGETTAPTDQVIDMTAVTGPIGQILEQLTALAPLDTKLQALAAQVAALAKHSGGGDTAAIGKAQAAIMNKLSGLESLLADDTSQTTSDITPPTATEMAEAVQNALSDQFSKVDTAIQAAVSDQPAQVAEAVRAALTDHLIAPTLIAEVTATLDRVANLPPPTLDLTAQRAGFAKFATVIAGAIARLEQVADQIAKPAGPPPVDNSAALADMQKAVADIATHLSDPPETPALDDMMVRMAALGETADTIKAELTALSNRPAPRLDLSAQRQSIAQFGTALGTVLQRLENIAANLSDGNDASAEVAIADTPTDEPVPDAPSFDISLADLRFQFAELIAQQIQTNDTARMRA
ncbi:MAG: hypothetical protein AAGF56_06865 [Pseudomonadota bacterium]